MEPHCLTHHISVLELFLWCLEVLTAPQTLTLQKKNPYTLWDFPTTQRGWTSGPANLCFHCVYMEWHGNSKSIKEVYVVISPPLLVFIQTNGEEGALQTQETVTNASFSCSAAPCSQLVGTESSEKTLYYDSQSQSSSPNSLEANNARKIRNLNGNERLREQNYFVVWNEAVYKQIIES